MTQSLWSRHVELPSTRLDIGSKISTWVTWSLLGIGVAAVAASAISMIYAGVGWDARIDTGQSLVIRETIPSLPSGTPLQEAYDGVYFTAEFYGILLPQLGDAFHSLVTGSSQLLQLNDVATYRWQGLANLFFAAVAAASLGIAVSQALRSRLAGAFTWALIMTTPIYFGMSTMNIKDMPVAAGLTLISAGLILSLVSKQRVFCFVLALLLVNLGSFLAIGTRPGLWPLVWVFLFASTGFIVAFGLNRHQVVSAVPAVIAAMSAPIVTLFLLWLTNPFGRMSLFQWLSDSFLVMRNYPWEGYIRTAGQDLYSTDLPWWYLPAWLIAQFPVLTSLTVIGGVLSLVWNIGFRGSRRMKLGLAAMTPVYIQAFALPIAVAASGATLYDGMRHVLFMVPALIGIGAILIASIANSEKHGRRLVGPLVALFVVLASLAATARWIPYSYAFVNPVAARLGDQESNWELDYWGLTAFEGVDRLQQERTTFVSVWPTEETSVLFGGRQVPGAPVPAMPVGSGLYAFQRSGQILIACRESFAVERDGQVLGVGQLC